MATYKTNVMNNLCIDKVQGNHYFNAIHDFLQKQLDIYATTLFKDIQGQLNDKKTQLEALRKRAGADSDQAGTDHPSTLQDIFRDTNSEFKDAYFNKRCEEKFAEFGIKGLTPPYQWNNIEAKFKAISGWANLTTENITKRIREGGDANSQGYSNATQALTKTFSELSNIKKAFEVWILPFPNIDFDDDFVKAHPFDTLSAQIDTMFKEAVDGVMKEIIVGSAQRNKYAGYDNEWTGYCTDLKNIFKRDPNSYYAIDFLLYNLLKCIGDTKRFKTINFNDLIKKLVEIRKANNSDLGHKFYIQAYYSQAIIQEVKTFQEKFSGATSKEINISFKTLVQNLFRLAAPAEQNAIKRQAWEALCNNFTEIDLLEVP